MRGRELFPWRRKSFFPAVFEFDVENFLDSFFDFFSPQAIRIDMRETESEYIVEADMPGYDKNSIDIRYENNLLTISAQHDEFTEEKRDNYIHRERRRGSFRRTIPVPENVDAEKIRASYNNGVLQVILPKITPSKPTGRRIEIE
ncbi:Hsp20/alpha crystallin family protein [Thermosediminibacter oceani]|uniref:Heat shock protein Hsp20 n=1 Tax=Thermosediminibacter oceani (strain ATCC BAA-1034 / DSM 16646 / JW/IW-1228P) TaxID=555079 RepID=D9RZ93_THEOJ|nr:Hsp20 family protein [Thermosediminibacter oceani]ADL08647.1 heat shock protein Hsp20 [Thermosediminibacter oceani DSM 16646]